VRFLESFFIKKSSGRTGLPPLKTLSLERDLGAHLERLRVC